MKLTSYKHFLILIIVACVQLAFLPASGQKVTRNFQELFVLTDHASLEIDNRYGNVDIRNWEKNEISVEVDVTVSHSDRDIAEKQLSYIDIDFSRKGNQIRAVTIIDQRAGQQWLRWFSSGREDTRININYTVYAPAESDLKITHRYGDVFINEARGHTSIDLRYGNLQANSILRDNTRPLSEINLAYSTKATITEADWLKVNMRYSDLLVSRCRALVVSSSYSKLKVDRASSIVSESRYGEFNMGHINNFVAESSYTNYSIDLISNSLDVESRYGNVRVGRIPADFSKVRFNSSYGNMRIGMDPGATYRIDASGSYGSIDIAPGNRVNRESRGAHFTISGIVGTGADPDATVEISTRYGNVNMTSR
jgi:hypothetical protein